jgi:hypothetical protein
VGRKQELDTKAAWLGGALLAQATQMEQVLQVQNNLSAKEQIQRMQGPRRKAAAPKPKQYAFGNTHVTVRRAPLPAEPSTANARPFTESSGAGRSGKALNPTRLGPVVQRPAKSDGGDNDDAATTKPGVVEYMSWPCSVPPVKAGARPATVGLSSSSPYTAKPQPAGYMLGGTARRKAGAEAEAAAAAARAAKQAEEEYRASHWRG